MRHNVQKPGLKKITETIVDVRVISRTSIEKYENTTKIIPRIAKEMHVSYFVEGYGQKIGDVIDTASDKHF